MQNAILIDTNANFSMFNRVKNVLDLNIEQALSKADKALFVHTKSVICSILILISENFSAINIVLV